MFGREVSPGIKNAVASRIRLPLKGCIPLLATAAADSSAVHQLCLQAAAENDENSDIAMELARIIRPDLLELFAPLPPI